MILQALTELFEDLVRQGKLSAPGWSNAKISYALCLDENGALVAVMPTQHEEDVKGKPKLFPNQISLPSPVVKASGIRSNFLWDNSSYLLGVDEKGKPERSLRCFRAAAELHHQLLSGVDTPAAKAILAYFDTWEPENAQSHPALADSLQEILKGGNLTFQVNGMFAQEDPAIQAAWNTHYYDTEDGIRQQCLVTGKIEPVASVHPQLKGVAGAQSSGAAIVSFNTFNLRSYGKSQGLNAPVSKYAAFAYTAALNYLLADKTNRYHIGDKLRRHQIGDTTIVCWAKGAEPQYTDFADFSLFGDDLPEEWTENDLRDAVKKLANGLPCPKLSLNPSHPFYVLGLSPNVGRLSVRFFYQDSFGNLVKHVNEHYDRLEIIGSRRWIMPLWVLLGATVNQNSKDKSPSPVMAGAVARAVFTGSYYPASLLEATMLRIRAERNITQEQAAILKAYYSNYTKNPNKLCPEEVLTVSLNPDSTNIPYTLGRLFAVYEEVQRMVNPDLNATIRDKYFNSASATPATIFPILDNLDIKHLRKINDAKLKAIKERQIGTIKNILGESYPVRLSLPEQGSFNLGYYHQRYTKKEDK